MDKGHYKMMMDAIGGYFGLEERREGVFPHKGGVLLNTGRNALEYILRSINDIKQIYLPYFTCEVVLEPIRKLNIPFSFYHIDKNLEISSNIRLDSGEYIIANNYFGIKDSYINELFEYYGNSLVADCSQSFFFKPIQNLKSFYSCRKFVGVSDGGIAYNDGENVLLITKADISSGHSDHLYIRNQLGAEAGFEIYKLNEQKLGNQDIKLMSSFTKDILEHIDFEHIKSKRCQNFNYLHEALKSINSLNIPDITTFQCPMVYPFWDSRGKTNREVLIKNKVFVAKYWPNISDTESFNIECQLADGIIPLPIDQRYSISDMNKILKTIL